MMNHNGEGTSIGKSGLSGQKTEQMITYVLEKQTNKQAGLHLWDYQQKAGLRCLISLSSGRILSRK